MHGIYRNKFIPLINKHIYLYDLGYRNKFISLTNKHIYIVYRNKFIHLIRISSNGT